MRSLNHPNIVKLIGICYESKMSLKLVLEYAKLGALNKYLFKRKGETTMKAIIRLCYQIALAMEYLTSKSIVHRDLAARNVLLQTEDLCKVTDFGLSRMVNDNNYYYHQAQNKSLLPLKWYPVNLISAASKRFDEKSDVWSFAVTCWEATSYGCEPYAGSSISMIEYSLLNEHRLEQPDKCPSLVYEIMSKCWNAKPDGRPTFSQLVKEFKMVFEKIYHDKV